MTVGELRLVLSQFDDGYDVAIYNPETDEVYQLATCQKASELALVGDRLDPDVPVLEY